MDSGTGMGDIGKDIRDFLMTRRAKIRPEDVGLPSGGRRRVPGLRREEVAMLAGVSAEYYVQVERGNVAGVSEEVLHAIATTLQLDEVETRHLFDLVHAASPRTARRAPRRSGPGSVPSGVQAIMDAMAAAPAIVQSGHLDILATNQLGRALYAAVFDTAHQDRPNLARFIFLDPTAEQTFPYWEKAADDAVALLRTEAGRAPYSRMLTDLVGELATRSEQFRTRWAAHDVRLHRRGTKVFRHAAVGEITLRYEGLEFAGAEGASLIAYTAEPGSPDSEALQLLASWTLSSPTPSR